MKEINRKIYIAVAVLAIIIVVGAFAGYQSLNTGTSGGGNTIQTVSTLGNATSVQFIVQSTSNGVMTEITFAGRNLSSTYSMLRVDVEGNDDAFISYLIFGNQTSWKNETGTWKPSDYESDHSNWDTNQFAIYRSKNASWSAGDEDIYYFDATGAEIKIFGITINPTLKDSLFTFG